MAIKQLRDVDVEKMNGENCVVVLLFYAEWCTSCKRLVMDVFPRIDAAFEGNANCIFGTVVIEEEDQTLVNQRLVDKHNVIGLPDIIVFDCESGQELGRKINCWGSEEYEYSSIRELVNSALAKVEETQTAA